MKKKVIEGARKLIKKLFEAILDREAFIFEAPKAFTRNFSRDMLTDDQLEVIDSWKAAVRGQLNTAEKLHADKRGLADHGDTYFEMLPLPEQPTEGPLFCTQKPQFRNESGTCRT